MSAAKLQWESFNQLNFVLYGQKYAKDTSFFGVRHCHAGSSCIGQKTEERHLQSVTETVFIQTSSQGPKIYRI